MGKGYIGNILHVDLSSQEISIEEPPDSFYRLYGGGSAMGTYYLLKKVPAGADPLGSDNVLTFFVGPPTGAPISGQSRVSVNAKSPLTGAVGDAQAGGFWPARLKFAGFDGVVVSGRSEKPVYLHIQNGQAKLRDASHLWGKITGEAEDMLREELDDKDIEVMQIGPAGENLVHFAAVINNSNRAAGRSGMGAVMGSKKLKAIVLQGRTKPDFHDSKAILALARWGAENLENSGSYGLSLSGTGGGLSYQHKSGGLPTRNWSSGAFEGHEAINGITMKETLKVEWETCFACVVRCKPAVDVTEGDYVSDPRYDGPEYETLATFGSYCGVDNLPAIVKANELCNKYGMDTISCGATIAWAMDAFEQGYITAEDTGGLALNFGNAAAMVQLVQQIGEREGFGDVLAEGSLRAAEKFGSEAQALTVTVKGYELPAHMPQVKRALGLVYAVNGFGADHMSGGHDPSYTRPNQRFASIGLNDPQPADSLSPEKVRFALYTHWTRTAANSLGVCSFVYGTWPLYDYGQLAQLVSACTGWEFSTFELVKLGERTVNLHRAFTAREGFGKESDVLPPKMQQALKGGASDGVSVPQSQMEAGRDLYYQMAGWDKNGRPTPAKLHELGIGWVADLLD